MKKLAVLFPGMGYTCAKPLLYYADALCAEHGYEVVKLDYGQIPFDKKLAFEVASERIIPQVLGMNFEGYDDIVFVSKSLGTALAGTACEKLPYPIRNFYMTPVPESLLVMHHNGITLSGSKDPWAPDHEAMRRGAEERGIPFYSFPGANHSLEVGNVQENLLNMKRVMEFLEGFLK